MAVTVTQLAAALRLGDGVNAPEEPQLGILTRLSGVALATVELFAPDAPEAIKDEAVIRYAGYLYDVPSAASGDRYAAAWVNSGAGSLVAGWVVRRIGGDEDVPTIRQLIAQEIASHAAIVAAHHMPPEPTALLDESFTLQDAVGTGTFYLMPTFDITAGTHLLDFVASIDGTGMAVSIVDSQDNVIAAISGFFFNEDIHRTRAVTVTETKTCRVKVDATKPNTSVTGARVQLLNLGTFASPGGGGDVDPVEVERIAREVIEDELQPGNTRGAEIARTAALPTAATTGSINTTFTVAAGAPSGVTGVGNTLRLPKLRPSNTIQGIWAVATVGGVEVDEVFIPWGGGGMEDESDSVQEYSLHGLSFGESADRNIDVRFFPRGSGYKTLSLEGDNDALQADSVVVFYLAQAVGATIEAGSVGVLGAEDGRLPLNGNIAIAWSAVNTPDATIFNGATTGNMVDGVDLPAFPDSITDATAFLNIFVPSTGAARVFQDQAFPLPTGPNGILTLDTTDQFEASDLTVDGVSGKVLISTAKQRASTARVRVRAPGALLSTFIEATTLAAGLVLLARDEDVDGTETDTSRIPNVAAAKRLIERLAPSATIARIPAANPGSNKVWGTDADGATAWRDAAGGGGAFPTTRTERATLIRISTSAKNDTWDSPGIKPNTLYEIDINGVNERLWLSPASIPATITWELLVGFDRDADSDREQPFVRIDYTHSTRLMIGTPIDFGSGSNITVTFNELS